MTKDAINLHITALAAMQAGFEAIDPLSCEAGGK